MAANTRDPSKVEHMAALGANVLVTAINNLSRKTPNGDIQNNLVCIENLVSTLLFFEASNPHDYIFALLALARDTPQQYCSAAKLQPQPSDAPFKIRVDYEIDAVELFRQFTMQCIATSGSLDIICRHWAPDVRGKEGESMEGAHFPSWILKLSDSSYGSAKDTLQGRRGADSLVGCAYRDTQKTYNAANGSKAIYRLGGPPQEYFMRTNTDTSTATHDSFSTEDLASSVTAMSMSRKTTSNETQFDEIEQKDFASVKPLPRPRAYSDTGMRRDSATSVRPSTTRTPSADVFGPAWMLPNMLNVKGIQITKIKTRSSRFTEGIVPFEFLQT
jgi:hypothetical protein